MKKKASNGFVASFFRNRMAAVGLFALVAIVLFCVIAPIVSDQTYYEIDLNNLFGAPSHKHPLGLDNLGRDNMVRLAYGGMLTLRIAFTAGIISAVFGGLIGVISGFFGSTLDFVIMRIIDVLSSIPALLLAIITEYAFGWGEGNFMYGLAIAGIPNFAKLMRASVLDIMSNEYIEASRALGAGSLRIIARHIIRNVIAPFALQSVTAIGDALLMCTIMGYLEIGINPPKPEWGGLFRSGQPYIRTRPFLPLLPTIAIVITTLSLHFIGNGIRDAFGLTGGQE